MPPLVQLEQELHLQLLSELSEQNRDQSQPLIDKDLQICTDIEAGLELGLPDCPTPNRDEAKIEKCVNSNTIINCPECGKGFHTDKAMFGHMRIHRDKGSKGFKKLSISKQKSIPKPEPEAEPICNLSWSVTKKRGYKPVLDRESEEVAAALFLMDLPNRCQCEAKKRRIEQSEPLDDRKYVCETCNKSFPSHQALGGHRSSHKKERENAAIQESTKLRNGETVERAKKKAKNGPHICEICGVSYPTGQQLGGHKRAHYVRNPSTSKAPANGDALL